MGKPQKVQEIAPALPSSVEAERAILGAIMLNNRAIEEAASLREEDFHQESHRKIFRAMLEMSGDSQPIDIVTLPDKLKSSGALSEVGGVAYLAQLSSRMPRTANIGQYIKIVRGKFMLRRVIEISDLAQRLAFEAGESEEEVVDQALQNFMELAVQCTSQEQFGKTSKSARVSFLQNLENKQNLLRVYTGIEELDNATGGFRSGELITITASVTGSGKTLFAEQLRVNACKGGLHGLYFSGEMPAEQLASRELATEAGVPHWKMRRPENLTSKDYEALIKSAGEDCEVCRIIDGDLSIRGIRLACRRAKSANNLSFAIIDYDELVDAPGKDEFAQQRIVIREAKRIAVTCEIPVFVISGIRKPLDKNDAKKPTLEKIYGSGAKSKHSSFVLFVDREYVRELKGDQTKARICILKARDGKVGEIPATFDLHTLRFREETEEEHYLRSKRHRAKGEENESEESQ